MEPIGKFHNQITIHMEMNLLVHMDQHTDSLLVHPVYEIYAPSCIACHQWNKGFVLER